MEKRVISTQVQEEDIKIEKSLRPQTLDDYIGQQKAKENLKVYTERVRIEESGTKTDVTRLISARMATEFERGLYYGKNE